MIGHKAINIQTGRWIMDAAAALYGAACRGWRQGDAHLAPGLVASVPAPFPTWSKPHLAAPRRGNWIDADLPEMSGVRWGGAGNDIFQGNPVLFWIGFGKDGRPADKKHSCVALAIDKGNTVAVFRKDRNNPKAWEPVPFLGCLESGHRLDMDGASAEVSASVGGKGRKTHITLQWRGDQGEPLTMDVVDPCSALPGWATLVLQHLGQMALIIAERSPQAVAPVEAAWDPRLWPAFLPRCDFDAPSVLSLVGSLRTLATVLHHRWPNQRYIKFTPLTESNIAYVYGSSGNTNIGSVLERIEPGSTTKAWQIHGTGQYVRLLPAFTLAVDPETSSHGVLRAMAVLREAGVDVDEAFPN